MAVTHDPVRDDPFRDDPARDDLGADPPPEIAAPKKLSREKSTKELAGDLARQTSTLIHQELDLARADIRDKAKVAGAGAGAMGVAAVTGLFGLACATAAGIAALSLVWPIWAAALLAAALYTVLAGILAGAGVVGIKKASGPVAADAIESTKEEAAWLTRQARSARK